MIGADQISRVEVLRVRTHDTDDCSARTQIHCHPLHSEVALIIVLIVSSKIRAPCSFSKFEQTNMHTCVLVGSPDLNRIVIINKTHLLRRNVALLFLNLFYVYTTSQVEKSGRADDLMCWTKEMMARP